MKATTKKETTKNTQTKEGLKSVDIFQTIEQKVTVRATFFWDMVSVIVFFASIVMIPDHFTSHNWLRLAIDILIVLYLTIKNA